MTLARLAILALLLASCSEMNWQSTMVPMPGSSSDLVQVAAAAGATGTVAVSRATATVDARQAAIASQQAAIERAAQATATVSAHEMQAQISRAVAATISAQQTPAAVALRTTEIYLDGLELKNVAARAQITNQAIGNQVQAAIQTAQVAPMQTAQAEKAASIAQAEASRAWAVTNTLRAALVLGFLVVAGFALIPVAAAWRQMWRRWTAEKPQSETTEPEPQQVQPHVITLKERAIALVQASIDRYGEMGDTLDGMPGREGQAIREALVKIGWVEVQDKMPTRVAGGKTLADLLEIVYILRDDLTPPPPASALP